METRYKVPNKPYKLFLLKGGNLYSGTKQAPHKPSQADFRKQGHNQTHDTL